MRPKLSSQESERRRRRAVYLIKHGTPIAEVVRMTGYNRRSLRRFMEAYRKDKRHGLDAKKAGRPMKLKDAFDVALILEEKLEKGARSAGFPTDRWTYPRVVELIFNHFGVRYSVDHIGRLLRSLDIQPKKFSARNR